MKPVEAKVYFVGAGPGDPELLTLKGMRVIERADVIIYADSLVNPQVCEYAREGAEIHGSSSLTLDEIVALMVDGVRRGGTVARIHTGDPSLFGALWEQMVLLDRAGIPYEIIPGVSSVFAAAATLGVELTVPELSQTVIITRLEGRTPVPEKERLSSLAGHNATIALFLSVAMIEEVVSELRLGGYPADTPVSVVQRASWADERTVRGSLQDIAAKVHAAGITRQALILVGPAMGGHSQSANVARRSRLYDKGFSHQYRKREHGAD